MHPPLPAFRVTLLSIFVGIVHTAANVHAVFGPSSVLCVLTGSRYVSLVFDPRQLISSHLLQIDGSCLLSGGLHLDFGALHWSKSANLKN